jgi:hypothetical protein
VIHIYVLYSYVYFLYQIQKTYMYKSGYIYTHIHIYISLVNPKVYICDTYICTHIHNYISLLTKHIYAYLMIHIPVYIHISIYIFLVNPKLISQVMCASYSIICYRRVEMFITFKKTVSLNDHFFNGYYNTSRWLYTCMFYGWQIPEV